MKNKIIINQPVRVSIFFFRVTTILNMKVTVKEIKHYQLKNVLIKLDHIQKYHE